MLGALLLVLLAVVCWLHRHRALGAPYVPKNTPVQPGALPLLGTVHQLLPSLPRIHDWFLEGTVRMGGRTWAITMPFMPIAYVVSDPVCLEHILRKRMENYVKGWEFAHVFGPLLGHGIFAADGESWYFQRKLAANIFSVASFKRHVDTTFAEKLQQLLCVLQRAADARTAVDLHTLAYSFTLDSFGKIAADVELGCLTSDKKVPFAQAFDEAQIITSERFALPSWAWPLLELVTGKAFVLPRDIAVVRSFVRGIIATRKKQRAARLAAPPPLPAAAAGDDGGGDDAARARDQDGAPRAPAAAPKDGGERADLLSLFMDAHGADGQPLSDEALVDAMLNLIIAARDTTAQALSWTFYLLLQHPEVEARLLQEIREVLGDDAVGRSARFAPTYEQLRAMRFARAVFYETLRLHPSVPVDLKTAAADDVLPDGTPVPATARIFYCPYTVNRLESYWGPDALEFKPQRWLDMDGAPSPYNYLSFHAGPRLCIGQRLAELEGVFVMSGLLARFSFRQVVPGAKVNYQLSTTLPMKEGLHVYVAPRA